MECEARIGFFVFKKDLTQGTIEADDWTRSYWWTYEGKRYRLRPEWGWEPWHEGTACTSACEHEGPSRKVITGYVVCFTTTDRCVALDLYCLVQFAQLARFYNAPLELEHAVKKQE